jgi:integrase
MTGRKTLLPSFIITEVTGPDDPSAIEILIPKNPHTIGGTYFIRPKYVPKEGARRGGKPILKQQGFNLFPVVLDALGIPWAEANMWVLSTLEGANTPSMSTYASIAEDLAAYQRFLDEFSINWLSFPSHKLQRPTYRFNGHLKHLIYNNEIAPTTAKRRMATVVRFYRWLQEEHVFTPEYSSWKTSDHYIEFTDLRGSRRTKAIVTTDVSIRIAKQDDPYDGAIDDGGKLRPLPQIEQEWLMDALATLGNTEMTLIHLFGLVTGARIQTILTFRVKHVLAVLEGDPNGELRFPVGPGTDIDTKYGKRLVLHIPLWFLRLLRVYVSSDRARKRRNRANGGDNENQYLFLSIRGAPLYCAQSESVVFKSANTLRHSKVGQGVRQYIREKINPFIQAKYGVPNFHFQFHDTRATYGMNLVDEKLKLVEMKQASLKEVMEFVQTRMGHESISTTERYLTYRSRLKMVRAAQDGWEAHLEKLALQVMENE